MRPSAFFLVLGLLLANFSFAQTTLTPATKGIGAGALHYEILVEGGDLTWVPNSNADWATVTPATGGGRALATVTVEKNLTGAIREATITIGGAAHRLTQSSATEAGADLLAVGMNDYGQLGVPNVATTRPGMIYSDAAAVATGLFHTLFIKTDGSLWAMGANNYGQLGDGSTINRPAPVQVATQVTSVAVGLYHTLFVKADGSLWAVGLNNFGQLGDGSTTSRLAPVQIAAQVATAVAGSQNSYFIKTDGSLWAMGANNYGQLGDGSTTNRSTPVQIDTQISAVAAGSFHAMFIKTDGTLWAMGYNGNGQLGDGTAVTSRSTPVQVAAQVSAVAGGASHSLCVKTDGTLWVTGYNLYGQLGDGGVTNRSTFGQIATQVMAVAAGEFHSLFIKTNGTLWATGANYEGQLGDGPTLRRLVPIQIAAQVATVAASGSHSLFIKNNGALWAMGSNSNGQLGDGSLAQRLLPLQVISQIVNVAAGASHSLFVKTNGSLWAMGANTNGQLGDATNTTRFQPVQIVSTQVAAAAAGESHSLFIKTDGSLWAMGANSNGQLGDGTDAPRYAPVSIATQVTAVTAGRFHSLYLKSDGSLWAMGGNNYGQLGDGSTTNRSAPVQIAAQVVSMSASDTHTLFVKSDGSLWATGSNSYGGFGDGSFSSRTMPVQIAADVTLAAAGSYTSFFIKTDGSLWAMGYNYYGQLGDGTMINRNVPVQIATGVSSVVANGSSSHFLKTDGSLWAVGVNSSGQLGDGTATNSLVPIPIASGVMAVKTGKSHSLILFGPEARLATHQLAVPAITWPVPDAITYGTTLSTAQLNATASVPGLFEYSPAVGALLDAGSHPLTLNFTPTDSASYQAVTTTRSLNVEKAPATIALANLLVAYTGSAHAALATTSPAGLGVRFTYDGGFTAPTITGSYAVVATIIDPNYTGTASGTLEIVGPPSVTTGSVSQTINEGGTLVLTATPSGRAPFSYQWFKDGEPIDGATGSSLEVSSADGTTAGSYTVQVSNAGGSATSEPSTVSVNLKPVLPSGTSNVNAPIGQDLTLTVPVSQGTPPFTYQWKKNGENIPGANSPTLIIPNATEADSGDYQFYVTNAVGDALSGPFKVVLRGVPLVFPFSDQIVAPGATAVFTTTFVAALSAELQWFLNGVPISNATDDVLTVGNVQLSNLGLYSLRVRDAFGETTKSATLKLSQQITFNSLPDVAQSSTPITLTATASSGLPVTFSAYNLAQSGNVVTPLNWGEGVVVAEQAGNEFYAAAAPVERRFRIISRYETWNQENFSEAELADPSVSGPEADPDYDGLKNFFEYALELNPREATTVALPTVGMIDGFWTYLYQRPVDRLDVTYQVEVSRDLQTWFTNGFVLIKQSDDGVHETWRTRYITEDTLPVFFRLKVSQQ